MLVVLLLPSRLADLGPAGFARLPVELLAGTAAVLALRRRWARVLVGVGAAAAAVLAVGRVADMGFDEVLRRPFDPVLDWPFVGDALEFLRTQVGGAGAAGAVVAGVVAVLALVALTTLAALRLARLVARHRRPAARTLAAATAVWAVAALLGLDTASGRPWAARTVVGDAAFRTTQVAAGLRDRAAFEAQARVDAFAGTPAADLLTGLRGKTVIVAFVESYGRSAVQDPAPRPGGRPGAGRGHRPARRRRASPPAAAGSPRRPSAGAAGSPTQRCCPGCGSTTSSATARSSPATASP